MYRENHFVRNNFKSTTFQNQHSINQLDDAPVRSSDDNDAEEAYYEEVAGYIYHFKQFAFDAGYSILQQNELNY